jgi:uncharacterized membrane protein YphA (DoxX/SURF4 family)
MNREPSDMRNAMAYRSVRIAYVVAFVLLVAGGALLVVGAIDRWVFVGLVAIIIFGPLGVWWLADHRSKTSGSQLPQR